MLDHRTRTMLVLVLLPSKDSMLQLVPIHTNVGKKEKFQDE
jgi:hypothetical protein